MGIIEVGSFVPDHYHKWEDQTFHIIEGKVEAKIGEQFYELTAGDTIHCPRGISHFIKNIGTSNARLVSYIFPGYWAEDFFAETSRQNKAGEHDKNIMEEKIWSCISLSSRSKVIALKMTIFIVYRR